MEAWLFCICLHIQFFLDSLEFKVYQENIHPTLTIMKAILAVVITVVRILGYCIPSSKLFKKCTCKNMPSHCSAMVTRNMRLRTHLRRVHKVDAITIMKTTVRGRAKIVRYAFHFVSFLLLTIYYVTMSVNAGKLRIERQIVTTKAKTEICLAQKKFPYFSWMIK